MTTPNRKQFIIPTIQNLKKELAALRREVRELKRDSAFGILTRPGLEHEFRHAPVNTYVVAIDLDRIHELNEKHGSQEPVDKIVRRALKVRTGDLILAGRWKSGDEIVFIVRSNPEGFANRLQASLKKNGLSATIAYEKIVRHALAPAVEIAMKKVYAAKRLNHRGRSVS